MSTYAILDPQGNIMDGRWTGIDDEQIVFVASPWVADRVWHRGRSIWECTDTRPFCVTRLVAANRNGRMRVCNGG